MGEEIKICLGCGVLLDKGIEFTLFTYKPNRYHCPHCRKDIPKLFSEIRNNALKIIERNQPLNNMFDDFVDDEEMFQHTKTKSTFYNSSHQAREYMFSLLEEVHRFAYHATFECHLFCDMFDNADRLFFSDRYFLTNSVIKTVGAWEKLLRFHCLYFEVKLDRNSRNNSLSRLQKKMNKTEFKQTNLYEDYIKLKSNGSFGTIDDARKNNDHNVSYHLGGKNYKELSKLAKLVLEHTDAIYNGLDEALQLLRKRTRLVTNQYIEEFGLVNKSEQNLNVFRKKALRLKATFNQEHIRDINQMSVGYIEWASKRLDEVSQWTIRYSNPPMLTIYYKLIDVTVRLHESARSLGYAAEMFRSAATLNLADLDQYWVKFDGLNYRYFIHSALIRMYGVYDKLGMIIQDLFEVELGNVTFETVIEHIRTAKNGDEFLNSLPPIKKCNRILSNSSYKRLYSSRQAFFHLLVKQDFMQPMYKEVIDFELMIAIIENSKMIYDLIDSIDVALVHFHSIGSYHSQTKR